MYQIFVESKWWNSLSVLKTIVKKESDNAGNISSKEDALNYYSDLYLEYVSISQVVSDCYDALIHPQKREDMRNIFILILCRIIDLRHRLVDCNVGTSIHHGIDPIPWEYIDMHKCLSRLKKRPIDIKVPIPSFLQDDENWKKKQRDSLVEGYMQLKYSLSSIPLEDRALTDKEYWGEALSAVDVGPEAEIINVFDSSLQESNARRKKSAIIIQKYTRGYIVRCAIKRSKKRENSFIGLIAEDDQTHTRNIFKDRVENLNQKRKEGQLELAHEYRDILITLDNLVRKQEFFDMKQSLMKERVEWVTEQITTTNEIPGDLEGFYKIKNSSLLNNSDGGNGKKSQSDSDLSNDKIHIVTPLKLLELMSKGVAKYEHLWKSIEVQEKTSFPTKYDEEIAKDIIVRDKVYNEAKEHVDDLLVTNLQRLKAIQSNKANDKNGADKKKTRVTSGKKGKSKKGKSKVLPGEKLSGLKSMDTAHMLSILIENKLVNNPDDLHIDDIIASDLPVSIGDNKESKKHPAPTFAQIRNMIVEYCILPLGSKEVMNLIDDQKRLRSILLYGCEKCGKTSVVQAIANHTRALLINLSPSKIPEKFLTEKHGTTKLVHMAFTVAKDPQFSPVIIYIDECEIYFQSSKRKKKANAAQKLQKDLLVYKNQALSKDDRVLVIGCSKSPADAELKTVKWKGPIGKPEKQGFFEKCIHIPCPSSVDRMLLWKTFIQDNLKTSRPNMLNIMKNLNFSLLSQESEGYSSGMIKSCVEKVLSTESVKLRKEPLYETMFIVELTNTFKKVNAEEEHCHEFTASLYSIKDGDKSKKKASKKK